MVIRSAFLAVFIRLLFFIFAGSCEGLTVQTIEPAWTRTMPEAYNGKWVQHTLLGLFAPHIFFASGDILTWYQFEENRDLMLGRELPLSGPTRYSLKAIAMDVHDGGVIKEFHLATAAPSAWLSNIPDPGTLFPIIGGLLLRTGGTVRFLSANDGRVLKQVRWSDVRNDAMGTVSVKVSRDGKRVIADYWGNHVNITCEFDGETFDLVSHCAPNTKLRGLANDGNWYPDLNSAGSGEKESTSEGPRPALNKHERMLDVQVSTDHSVGAAIVVRVKGESKYWDIPGHYTDARAIVYDIASGRVLESIPFPFKEGEGHNLQLSQNGNWIALLNGTRLRAYQIKK